MGGLNEGNAMLNGVFGVAQYTKRCRKKRLAALAHVISSDAILFTRTRIADMSRADEWIGPDRFLPGDGIRPSRC